MSQKLTIDINLMVTETKSSAMDTLKRWKSEGKIELIEADPPKEAAYGWPGSPPPKPEPRNKMSWGGPPARSKKMAESGNATFKSLASVLFPGKDSHKLNMMEINDVAHLIKHHMSKNDFFVTANLKDFIEGGRRDLLKSYFGIVVVTPEEIVRSLGDSNGWEYEGGKPAAAAKPRREKESMKS